MSDTLQVELSYRSPCRDDAGPKSEVVLAPDGSVESTQGDFVVDEESGRLAKEAFDAHGIDVVIDYEHQTLGGKFAAPDGKAPAAGWVEDLWYEQGRGIVGKVEWNPDGRAAIKMKLYRYLSPVAIIRKSDRKLVGLHSAGLTNKPAIRNMAALAAKQRNEERSMDGQTKQVNQEEPTGGGDIGVIIKQIIVNLGIEEGEDLASTLRNIEAATKKKSDGDGEGAEGDAQVAASTRKELGLDRDASAETVINKIREKDGHIGYVKAEDHKAMAQRLQTLEQANAQRDAESLVDSYVQAGKLNPDDTAEMEWARQQAQANSEAFQMLMSKAQDKRPSQGRTTPPKDGAGGRTSNEETLINKALADHDGNHKNAMVALQSRLMGEHTDSGLTTQAARERCEGLYPVIFG